MRTTYATQYRGVVIEVTADWASASADVDGLPGWQVADCRHRPSLAMRAAIERECIASGDDVDELAVTRAIADMVAR
jgi:hypothetical protein